MKSKQNLLDQLKVMPHFSKDSLYQLGKQLGLADATVNTYISRFLRHKEIFQLKRGLYVAADFFSKNRSNPSYTFYLANIIRTPSYVSSWSALQFYNLTTEAIHGISSVTPKVTRTYKTKAGTFTYQSLKQDLFSDFSLMRGKGPSFDFFIASPAKALFDLLYFKTHQFRGVRIKDTKALVEELRIDIDEMDTKERSRFYAWVEKCFRDE